MGWENFAFADNNADGLGDAGSADLNSDGRTDSQVFDTDFDGGIDTYHSDPDGDGYSQAVLHDQNQDGIPEVVDSDTDGNGITDLQTLDGDHNGVNEVIRSDTDHDGDFDTTMGLNNQTGQLENVTTPDTGQVPMPANPPAADSGIVGGSAGQGISSSPVSMANRADAGTIGGSDDYTSSFVGGSPTGVIGGSSSGGLVDPLLNSPALMNDPAAVNLAANMIEGSYVNTVRWTLPDGFEIVEWD